MAAPGYAKQVYQSLLAHGYSTTQAIGIMANMYFESSLNPEANAMDSNGYRSYGLVQFNGASFPNAGSFVTGNPTADINKQVSFLASQSSTNPRTGSAVQGSTPSAVAGNWAYHFERCAACSPSGSYGASPTSAGGYNARVAMASTVAQWVKSGGWPSKDTATGGAGGGSGSAAGAGAGSAVGSSTGGGYNAASGTGSATTTGLISSGVDCLVSIPVVGGCLFTRSQARAIIGGMTVIAGVTIALVGLAMLFRSARAPSGSFIGKAAQATGEIVALFPPATEAGVALTAAGGAVNRTAQHRQQSRRTRVAERGATAGERRATVSERGATTAERRTVHAERTARTRERQQSRSAATAERRARVAEQREERLSRPRGGGNGNGG